MVTDEYLSSMRNEEQKKSYKLYRIACEKFQKYMKGDFPLIQLTPLHIQGFANTMKEEGLSATSVRIYLTLIRVILNYARKMNYVNYPVHPLCYSKCQSVTSGN